MAQIIPGSPVGSLPAEVVKAFRVFKDFPDGYRIWHHLTPWDKEAPDFLLVNPENQALLVKVSLQSDKNSRPAAQQLLLEDDRTVLGADQERVLTDFLERLTPKLAAQIPFVVIFPNLTGRYLAANLPAHKKPMTWVGQELLQFANQSAWESLFTGNRLYERGIDALRQHFTPESVVPATLTVRPPDNDRQQAGLTDYLLDSQQEHAVKNDLDLPVEQQNTSKDFHVGIINGVAGSGKTLILLYRLRLLHALFPQKSFLVLTHNKPLILDLKSRYKRLTGDLPRNIQWRTFNAFCRKYWPESVENAWTEPLTTPARTALIQTIWEKYFVDTTITAVSLESELDWFKDQLPMDRETYLKVERKGRGFRLHQEQRAKMWDAIREYQIHLKASHSMDWGDVPRRMWSFLRDGKARLPVYDVILIDEAQFFAPIWFDIIRQCIKPRSGHLFIVADPTQGFLGRGNSWKSFGIDARGKTNNIRRSYRTTHEILNFATLFYRKRILKHDTDDDVLEPDLMNMPRGVLPVLLPVRAAQDEIGAITAEIVALHTSGYPLRNILVLHAEYGVQALIASIDKQLGAGKAADPKNDTPDDCVRVTTLNAGTGLESPIVFLAGLNHLFEREQSLRLSDEEADRLMLDNTRKVYMAATRAGQRLVITYVGKLPDILQELLVDGI